MKKVKVKDEYFIDLLDKKKGSVRELRGEDGFTLLDERPDWATDENLWTQTSQPWTKKIEGWEKLCIEAYLCGWIDYFDIQVQKLNDDDARTIYFEWKEDKKKNLLSLKVYLYSDPPLPAPDPPSASQTSVPKPPPPPLS
jgi:hypothetical protein